MLGLQVMERCLKKLVSNTEHDPMTFVYAVTLVTFSWHIVRLLHDGLCWDNQHLPSKLRLQHLLKPGRGLAEAQMSDLHVMTRCLAPKRLLQS